MATIVRTEKRCPRCGRVLPAAEFGRNGKACDGLQSYCRACHREYFAAYREQHPKPRAHPADYVPLKYRTREERLARMRELYRIRMNVIVRSPLLMAEFQRKARERQAKYKAAHP